MLRFDVFSTGLIGDILGDHGDEGDHMSLDFPGPPVARGLGLPFLFIELLVGLPSCDKDNDPTGDIDCVDLSLRLLLLDATDGVGEADLVRFDFDPLEAEDEEDAAILPLLTHRPPLNTV